MANSRDKSARRSLAGGAIARGRWLLASASLRLRPKPPPKPVTLESLSEDSARIEALRRRLEAMIRDEERTLGSSAVSSSKGDPWAAAVARLAEDTARASPRRRSRRASLSMVESALRALEGLVSSLTDRRQVAESAVAEWQGRAERAVVAGDDVAALRALEHKRLMQEALDAMTRELELRKRLLTEWSQVADRFRDVS